MFIALLVFVSILFAILIYILCNYVAKKLENVIIENSFRYEKILELNDKYDFNLDVESQYIFYKNVKSKQQFDRFDYEKFFIEQIEIDEHFFSEVKNKIERNRELYVSYKNEIDVLYEFDLTEEVRKTRIPYFIYKEIESKVFEDKKANPVVSTMFICKVSYISPQGRNHYDGEKIYTLEDLEKYKEVILNKIEYKKSHQYQRNMMTKSLRYDILQRDNFKCVLCGRSANEGIVLHVDHIVPISKGGKTEKDNLRTLCEDCNLGKSDKYEKEGVY